MRLLGFIVFIALSVAALRAQTDSAAHHKKGQELAAQQQWDEARREYLESLRLDPGNQAARLDLARLQVMARQFEPALSASNTVLQAEPGNVDAELVRASALIGLGKPGVARLFLLDALQKHPNHTELLFELGVVCLADRRYDEALDAFRKTWKADPGNARGLAGVVEVQLAQKETAKALDAVQAEVAKTPDRRDLLILLGNTAVRVQKFPVAIDAFQKAVAGASGKELADVYSRLAEAQRRGGNLGASVAALEKAREAAPNDPKVLGAYALSLDAAGRRKQATEAYAAAVELDPRNGFLLNNYAFLLAETGGDLKLALELAQKAREILPTQAQVTDTVGWIYVKANMTDAAIGLFEYLVVKEPDAASYRYHYAVALAQKGDKAGARRELQEAIKRGAAGDDLRQIRELAATLKQ